MRSTLIAAVALAITAAGGAAQTCTYDQCALRVEGQFVKVGLQGMRLGKLGLFQRPTLTQLPSMTPDANAQFEIFEANFRKGQVFGLASAVLIVAATRESISGERGSGLSIGLTVAAVGSAIIGGVKSKRALDGLSRGIWHYNRQFAK